MMDYIDMNLPVRSDGSRRKSQHGLHFWQCILDMYALIETLDSAEVFVGHEGLYRDALAIRGYFHAAEEKLKGNPKDGF